ncbi:MAG: NAD-dependent epimerase/dehydratase family protein [Synergistaceae bacterium]|nr:NAD-dependent epimerase/dehydratase family protein [Synergistaceae bacterium]
MLKFLDRKIKDRGIDVFFHMAWSGGFTSALKDYSLQFQNAKAACDAVSSAVNIACKKFVFAGTVNEIEINQFINSERFVPRGTNIYASVKVAADMTSKTMAYLNHMDYCSALIPLPYGAGNSSPQLINTVIKNCYEGKPSRLIEGNNQYDIAHISDIARALYLIGEKGINMRSYYIGHRKLRTFREIVCNIRDVINPQAELRFGKYQDSLNLDYSYGSGCTLPRYGL